MAATSLIAAVGFGPMFFLNPQSLTTLVIAGVLFWSVAPHLQLVSGRAGLAVKLAAAFLVLGPAMEFGMSFFLYRIIDSIGVPIEPWRLIPLISRTPFWLCLAWSVLEMVKSAKPKGAM